ncbi:MAG: 2-hydroxychromene-2-carboxylate isomerase [Rhodospirillaceae bacterium]|nr:2-hydroxychromene-2-carboxylate isomerase [Rhodospirillaceae bacterium]MBT5300342.1 2-hydroxychromene-2-carboxylate isomerase [Rhodospirillaceae bacterium]MBT5512963.1 2-hydroxychromene-2-carboxylate isomerase [Rhodospirillaceae bacterium]MBT6085873.1 2-hydroxychromene-2-carboxylate isomerase [Rhodospirillaceae bacterium]MBT6607667.1 2-hydroxychromene-2-carboxylate isomerase [Rhodospirillaceae bacterium]
MSDPVKFYFDFSSPYSYFAAQKIDFTVEACGRTCEWKPFLLGALFKVTNSQPLTTIPMKGDYCRHDWERMSKMMDIAWTMPDPFPIPTQAAARAFYWLNDDNPDLAKSFAKAAFARYFGEGRDITSADAIAEVAAPLGVDQDALLAAVNDDAVKQRLKDETAAAIDAGVFGAPFFIVDGEGFWGNDRLWMIKRWIKGEAA